MTIVIVDLNYDISSGGDNFEYSSST